MPLRKSKFPRIGAATASTVPLLGGVVGAAKIISPTNTHTWVGSETSPSGFVDMGGRREKNRARDKETKKKKTRSTKAGLAARVGDDSGPGPAEDVLLRVASKGATAPVEGFQGLINAQAKADENADFVQGYFDNIAGVANAAGSVWNYVVAPIGQSVADQFLSMSVADRTVGGGSDSRLA